MSSSTGVEITVIDRLSWDLPRAEEVESAIRTAFEGVRGGPWIVTLRPPAYPDSQVTVSVRGPHSVMLTSFALDATPADITDRLVGAMQTAY
jgi:hypothetical protein